MSAGTTQQNRFIEDRYLAIGNKLFFFDVGKVTVLFDGAKYGFHQSFIVDFYRNGKNGIYVAFYGETKGLYYFSDFKRMIPIYTESNVNSVAKNKFGHLFFSNHGSSLFAIKYAHAIKYAIPLQETESIESVINIPNSENVIIQSDQKKIYVYDVETADQTMLKNLGEHGMPFVFKDGSTLAVLRDNNYFQLDQFLHSTHQPVDLKAEIGNSILKVFKRKSELFIFCKNYLIRYNLVDNSSLQYNYEFNLNDVSSNIKEEIELYTNKGIYSLHTEHSGIQIVRSDSTKVGESEILKIGIDTEAIYCLTSRNILKRFANHQEEVLSWLPGKNQMFKVNAILSEQRYLFFVKNKQIDFYDKLTKQYCRYIVPFLESDEYILGGFLNEDLLYYYSPKAIYTLPILFFDKLNTKPFYKISSVYYNQKVLTNKSDSIVLQFHKENSLKLNFDYLNGIFLDNDLISYQLLEGNNLIQEATIHNNEIVLKKLDYGVYTLKIIFQKKEFMKISLSYIPIWYQTNGFKLTVTLMLLLFVIYLIYLFFQQKYLRKKHDIEMKMNLFALEGGAKLNQLKPHFVFNSLIPIQHFILKNKKEEALSYLEEFSTLIRAMLNMSRDSTTTLGKELEFLRKFLQLKKSELSNSLNFEIHSEFDVNESAIVRIPTLLIQPIVENAIANGRGFVRIQFLHESEFIVNVVVSDNGDGFDLNAQNGHSTNNHALNIIKERLALYQHSKGVPSGLNTFFSDNLFNVKISIPIYIE
jgi:hypothetical protein